MMQKITKHNCKGLCQEQFCDRPEEFFDYVEINGLKLIVVLCKEHGEKWDKEAWRKNAEGFLEERQFQKIQKMRPCHD